MSKMSVTISAQHFDSRHEHRSVRYKLDIFTILRLDRIEKTWPTRSGIEFLESKQSRVNQTNLGIEVLTVSDSKSGWLQQAHKNCPFRCSSFSLLEKGRSVPFSLATWNVLPSSTSFHSASFTAIGFSRIFCLISSLDTLELLEAEEVVENPKIPLIKSIFLFVGLHETVELKAWIWFWVWHNPPLLVAQAQANTRNLGPWFILLELKKNFCNKLTVLSVT